MAEKDNICKFSSAANGDSDLFAFQFIYETMPARLGDNRSYAAFVCHLVTEGSAIFHTAAGSFSLEAGDLFFAFPSLTFTLECDENFKYLYIAFIGSHATEMLAAMEVTRENPVHRGCGGLTDIWFGAIGKCSSDNLAFMTKGVLYYTFACLKQSDPEEKTVGGCEGVVAQIREAIEQNYANADFALDHLCRQLRYNSNYISRRFREIVGISFSDYLISCRMRHACILLDETNMTVREISAAVGYRDALYFSKVFRRIMKTSPSEYRENDQSTDE